MGQYVLSHKQACEMGQNPEPLIYDLVGVINHYGSMNFGHYVAFAKNSRNSKWYEFNDSSVSHIEPDAVCTSAAYVLFYKKRGFCAEGINFKAI